MGKDFDAYMTSTELHKYAGKWVAFKDGKIVAAEDTYDKANKGNPGLVVYVPKSSSNLPV